MENFSYHLPFYVVTGGVATSGHSSELTGGKVGLYDRHNFNVATSIGNGKELFFAQSNIGGKDWYGQPVTETHKSAYFYAKDVENIYLSKPQELRNEEWVIGYNGSPSSVGLKYETGVPIRIKFYFHGQPIYRFFNGPKEYVVSYTPTPDCVTPCEEGDCPPGIADCLYHTQQLINNINSHTELKKFGVTAKFVRNDFVAATPNMTKRCLTLCDNGDNYALQAVQAQVSSLYKVVRTARVGSLSTYEFCQANVDAAPAAFVQSGSVLEAVCGVCPSDSFLVGAKDVYYVKRPIVGGETISTPVQRDTFANTVWTAYASAEGITTTTSTTSTTTAAGTFNADATWVAQDGSLLIVKLKFPEGTQLDAIGTDILEFSHTEAARCFFDNPDPIAWVSCGSGIRSQRQLRINGIKRPDCNTAGNRLADITAALDGVVGIQIGTLAVVAGSDGCFDDYTISQWSQDCLDEGCLTSNVTFNYDTLPSFENVAWEVVPPTVTEDDERACGIRVTAGYIDPRFGDCSFNPMDYYETEPIKLEVSLLGEDWDRCDYADRPTVRQSQIGQISRQTGEYVVREVIMKNDAYLKHVKQFSLEPRMREAFDQNLLNSVDRTALYDLYYVTYAASYGNSFRKQAVQEKFTTVFAFKQGDATALQFETQILDTLTAKSGVVMHVNEANEGGTSGLQGIGS